MRFLYKSACDTRADYSNLLGDGPGGDDDDGGSDGAGDVDDGGCDGGAGVGFVSSLVVVMVVVMVHVLLFLPNRFKSPLNSPKNIYFSILDPPLSGYWAGP